jgi:hypothetical protein
VVWWFRAPPQIGGDDDVFLTVDALFTAITARDEKLLGASQARLATYQAAGKLPDAAARELDRLAVQAKSGDWRGAAERLYAFMQGQRREGAEDRSTQEKVPASRSHKGRAAASKLRR